MQSDEEEDRDGKKEKLSPGIYFSPDPKAKTELKTIVNWICTEAKAGGFNIKPTTVPEKIKLYSLVGGSVCLDGLRFLPVNIPNVHELRFDSAYIESEEKNRERKKKDKRNQLLFRPSLSLELTRCLTKFVLPAEILMYPVTQIQLCEIRGALPAQNLIDILMKKLKISVLKLVLRMSDLTIHDGKNSRRFTRLGSIVSFNNRSKADLQHFLSVANNRYDALRQDEEPSSAKDMEDIKWSLMQKNTEQVAQAEQDALQAKAEKLAMEGEIALPDFKIEEVKTAKPWAAVVADSPFAIVQNRREKLDFSKDNNAPTTGANAEPLGKGGDDEIIAAGSFINQITKNPPAAEKPVAAVDLLQDMVQTPKGKRGQFYDRNAEQMKELAESPEEFHSFQPEHSSTPKEEENFMEEVRGLEAKELVAMKRLQRQLAVRMSRMKRDGADLEEMMMRLDLSAGDKDFFKTMIQDDNLLTYTQLYEEDENRVRRQPAFNHHYSNNDATRQELAHQALGNINKQLEAHLAAEEKKEEEATAPIYGASGE